MGQEAGALQHKQTAEPSPKDPNSRASSATPPGPSSCPSPAEQALPSPPRPRQEDEARRQVGRGLLTNSGTLTPRRK